MLVLSRKRGESILIGDDVEVRVVDIGDGKVRLGVVGPACMSVHQPERYEAVRLRQGPKTGTAARVPAAQQSLACHH